MEWAELITSVLALIVALVAAWSKIVKAARTMRATVSTASMNIKQSSKWELAKVLLFFAPAFMLNCYFLYRDVTADGPVTRGAVFKIAADFAVLILVLCVAFTVIMSILTLRAAHRADMRLLDLQIESNDSMVKVINKVLAPPGEKS